MDNTLVEDDIDDWTCSDVLTWLKSIDCPENIVAMFRDKSIDGYQLRRLLHLQGKKINLSAKRRRLA